MKNHSFQKGFLPRKEYPGFDKTHSDKQIDYTKLNWSIIYGLECGIN